jgi:hypothetical protein
LASASFACSSSGHLVAINTLSSMRTAILVTFAINPKSNAASGVNGAVT